MCTEGGRAGVVSDPPKLRRRVPALRICLAMGAAPAPGLSSVSGSHCNACGVAKSSAGPLPAPASVIQEREPFDLFTES